MAKAGSERIYYYEHLGFKIDEEDIFRLGLPYFETTIESACVGERDGYRLYETPKKKYHLLTNFY